MLIPPPHLEPRMIRSVTGVLGIFLLKDHVAELPHLAVDLTFE